MPLHADVAGLRGNVDQEAPLAPAVWKEHGIAFPPAVTEARSPSAGCANFKVRGKSQMRESSGHCIPIATAAALSMDQRAMETLPSCCADAVKAVSGAKSWTAPVISIALLLGHLIPKAAVAESNTNQKIWSVLRKVNPKACAVWSISLDDTPDSQLTKKSGYCHLRVGGTKTGFEYRRSRRW
jgi:hypothetical protein